MSNTVGKKLLLAAQEHFLQQVDAGDTKYLNILSSPSVQSIETAGGAETRKVYNPTGAGQILIITFKTDGGNCVITFDSAFNVANNTIMTFADVSDTVMLVSVPAPGSSQPETYVWSIMGNDGAVALS